MAFTTEVRDQIKEILDFSGSVTIDVANAISHATPVLDYGQKIFDVDVVISIEIGITVLLEGEILLDPLDGGLMILLARLVVEDDPEWLT